MKGSQLLLKSYRRARTHLHTYVIVCIMNLWQWCFKFSITIFHCIYESLFIVTNIY